MIELSPEVEALLQAKAAGIGRTPDEVLREVLARVGAPAPWRNSVAERPRNLSKNALVDAMEAISVRSCTRPLADPRSPDEIAGYDDFGLPR